MSATAWLIIVTLLIAALGTYKMLARETGFRIFVSPLEWFNELSDSSTTGGKKGFWATRLKKWEAKDLESKRWFLYVALAVLAIVAVYVTPVQYSEYRFQIGGWIVLLGLHLVIWPFYTEKISLVTKIVITGFILFFIVAVVLPNATQKEVANVKEKITSFDRGYEITPPYQATQRGIPSSIVAVREKPSD